MEVRSGPVTVLAVVHEADGASLLVAEGEAVPGEIMRIGNTNSRYRFPCGARAFIERWSAAGPSHHAAVAVGHHAHWLAKLADLCGIPCTTVGR
jgi:L-arabinose isomerase